MKIGDVTKGKNKQVSSIVGIEIEYYCTMGKTTQNKIARIGGASKLPTKGALLF